MNYTIKITDKYLHEIIDTLEKIAADRDGDMLLMSRIEYAERLSSKSRLPRMAIPEISCIILYIIQYCRTSGTRLLYIFCTSTAAE